MADRQVKFEFPEGLPEDSGFLDGHFADNPIVPGAVLLGFAAEGLSSHGQKIGKLARVKFLRQLKPSIPFEITCDIDGHCATITWITAEGPIAEARAKLDCGHG